VSGKLLAQSKEEWPDGWDDTASFGNLSGEKGWVEYIRRQEKDKVVEPPPLDPDVSAPIPPPSGIRHSESPLTSPPSTTPSEPSPFKSSTSDAFDRSDFLPSTNVEMEDCIEVQLPPELEARRRQRTTKSRRTVLEGLARTLDISDSVVDAAEQIFAKVEQEGLPKTKLLPTMLARSALLEASRHLGIPKTFAEMERDLPKSSRSKFHKQFKIVDGILRKNVLTSATTDQYNYFPLISVELFISFVGNSLGLSDAVRERAVAIANTAEVKDLFAGKRPNVIAAVVLSFAAECENVFKSGGLYAKAASVSDNTILNNRRALLRLVEDMAERGPLPPSFRAPWNTGGIAQGA